MNIRRIAMLATLVCGVFLTCTANASTFEGIIHMQTQADKHVGNLAYYFKGRRMRMEFSGDESKEKTPSYGIMDWDNKTLVSVIPDQKMYMNMSLEGTEKVVKKQDYEVTKTGRTETIHGYKCEEWLVKSKRDQSQVWAASMIGQYASFSGGWTHGKTAFWEREMARKGYFPFRVISMDSKGKERSRMEVVKVEKKGLSGSLFEIPAGYKKFQMPSLKDMMSGKMNRE